MTKKIGLIFIICLSISIANAQVNDAQLWTKLSVSKTFSQSFQTQIDLSTRFGNNITDLNTFYLQLSGEYKLAKWLKLGANFRYAEKYDLEEMTHSRYRGGIYALLKKKFFKTLELQYRTMYQHQYTDIYTSEKGTIPTYYFRNKLNVSLDLDQKYSPYVSCEMYHKYTYKFQDLSKLRYALGVNYEINNLHKIDLYYLIQKETNVSNPLSSYVIGLAYKLSL